MNHVKMSFDNFTCKKADQQVAYPNDHRDPRLKYKSISAFVTWANIKLCTKKRNAT